MTTKMFVAYNLEHNLSHWTEKLRMRGDIFKVKKMDCNPSQKPGK